MVAVLGRRGGHQSLLNNPLAPNASIPRGVRVDTRRAGCIRKLSAQVDTQVAAGRTDNELKLRTLVRGHARERERKGEEEGEGGGRERERDGGRGFQVPSILASFLPPSVLSALPLTTSLHYVFAQLSCSRALVAFLESAIISLKRHPKLQSAEPQTI